MNPDDVKRHILDAFEGIDAIEQQGDTFLIYDPARRLTGAQQQPFATIVTGDHYDAVSALDRPGAFRLNVGLTKATYLALFGPPPTERDEQGVLRADVDYTAIDTWMPHPYYGSQYWVSIVEPSDAAWPRVLEFLTEAHAFAARKYANQDKRLSG